MQPDISLPHRMLTPVQIKSMLALQAGMNQKVDEDWVRSRHPYLRAVVIEGAEAIEHHGWKWWKKQDKDLSQLQMELIDIWHFLLSELLLQTNGELAPAATLLQNHVADNELAQQVTFDGQIYMLEDIDLLAKIELLIGVAASKRVEIGLFAAIMTDCGLSWDELYRQYVGKNVLNFFRQDHGYKSGEYQKLWNGREDNEHLVDVLDQLDARDSNFQDQIYGNLAERYPLT